MTRHLLAATALATGIAAFAAPANARDRSGYFGIEVGGLQVTDTDVGFDVDGDDLEDDFLGGFEIEHKLGVDGDLIAGYDFGMFRIEAELGYKRSHHDEYSADFDLQGEEDVDSEDAKGRSSVYSLMANAMIDVGDDQGVNFYAGAGIGWAQVIHLINARDVTGDSFKIKDRGLAWQLIAGVRYPMWEHFDVGVKYRYFNADNVDDDFDFDEEEDFGVDSDYKSHSLLLSLIYNFNAPPAPPPPPPPVMAPPPPPPPPATQTCPDGSVILATDSCPLPPPPPPPPPPEPERG